MDPWAGGSRLDLYSSSIGSGGLSRLSDLSCLRFLTPHETDDVAETSCQHLEVMIRLTYDAHYFKQLHFQHVTDGTLHFQCVTDGFCFEMVEAEHLNTG